MHPEKERSTGGTVEIHPYVQARLRALPRQQETAGILLGTLENDITRITGFKRVPAHTLRQAADAAGPALAGFYRLHTPDAPSLRPEEVELWRAASSHSLFLLIQPANRGAPVEAAVWTRRGNGEPVVETISLDGNRGQEPLRLPELIEPAVEVGPIPVRQVPWRAIALTAAALSAAAAVALFWPAAKPAPEISLDLQARPGELIAMWEQKGTPAEPPRSATLSIRDGANEQAIDLTRSFAPRGRLVLRPVSRDISVTLNVQYAGIAPVSGSATYVGFAPAAVQEADAAKSSRGTRKAGSRRRARSR